MEAEDEEKTPRSLDKKFKEPKSLEEAFDVVILGAENVYKVAIFLKRTAQPLIIALFAALILTFLLQINRDDKVDQLQIQIVDLKTEVHSLKESSAQTNESANKAAVAASAAQQSLQEAIAQSQRGGTSPEVTEALSRINEIYACVKMKEC